MSRYDDIDELERVRESRKRRKIKKVKKTKFRSRSEKEHFDYPSSVGFDHPRPRSFQDLVSGDYLRR